jgi:hypothetical protein
VAAKQTLTVTIRITGLRETILKFRDLPKEASKELRKAAIKISKRLATDAQVAARGDSAQSALMAPTIRAVLDRFPAVVAGGNRRVGSNKVPAFKILFGSEFGTKTLPQYRPFNKDGYWFFPTVREDEAGIGKEWQEAADTIIHQWAR